MNTNKKGLINQLIKNHIPGTVELAADLYRRGISYDLQKQYRKSGWLEPIGTGAFVHPGEHVDWHGGLYAIQAQAGRKIHIGALTALQMHGMTHFIRTGNEPAYLFSQPGVPLPAWFLKHRWSQPIHHEKSAFLPDDTGIGEFRLPLFTLSISGRERAMLEMLFLSPGLFDLMECYHIMEGLATLRPKHVQQLLEECRSVKVKRLFLFMAEKAGHEWFKRIRTESIELGKGKRSLAKGGVLIKKYGLSVPRELAS